MSAVDIAANLFGTISLIFFALRVYAEYASILFVGSQYRQARFGAVGHLLYIFRIVDTDALERLHWNINTWTAKEVLEWKQQQQSTYNAIVVAGAIFASIGLTSLQLPNMNDVHWIARSLCACSMICGIMSVSTATLLYQELGQLTDALSIRLWLSRGKPSREILDYRPGKMQMPSKYYKASSFDLLPLESSTSSLKRISLPRHLLDMAVVLFIAGFGLYWLFLWLDSVEGEGVAWRNVFIILVLTVGLFLLYVGGLYAYKFQNEQKKAIDFDIHKNNVRWKQSQAIRDLEKQLEVLRNAMDYMSADDAIYGAMNMNRPSRDEEEPVAADRSNTMASGENVHE